MSEVSRKAYIVHQLTEQTGDPAVVRMRLRSEQAPGQPPTHDASMEPVVAADKAPPVGTPVEVIIVTRTS